MVISAEDLNAVLRSLAQRYSQGAAEVLGGRLSSAALFGSVARGEAGAGSDIDLFVVLKEAPAGMLPRRALLEPVRQRLQGELEPLWRQGVYADFAEVIRTEGEARCSHPLHLPLATEAEVLFDRAGFLEAVLAPVRRRLEAGEARLRILGRVRYWDLRPQVTARARRERDTGSSRRGRGDVPVLDSAKRGAVLGGMKWTRCSRY